MEYSFYLGMATIGLSLLAIIGLIVVIVVTLALLGKIKVKSRDIVVGSLDKYKIDEVADKVLAEARWRGLSLSIVAKTDAGVAFSHTDIFEELNVWVRKVKDQVVITYSVSLTPGFIALLAILVLLGWPWAALVAGLWYARFKGHSSIIEQSVEIVSRGLG